MRYLLLTAIFLLPFFVYSPTVSASVSGGGGSTVETYGYDFLGGSLAPSSSTNATNGVFQLAVSNYNPYPTIPNTALNAAFNGISTLAHPAAPVMGSGYAFMDTRISGAADYHSFTVTTPGQSLICFQTLDFDYYVIPNSEPLAGASYSLQVDAVMGGTTTTLTSFNVASSGSTNPIRAGQVIPVSINLSSFGQLQGITGVQPIEFRLIFGDNISGGGNTPVHTVDNIQLAVQVPEPTSLGFLAVCALGFVSRRRRR